MSNSASVQNISTRNTEKTELRFTSLNSSAGKANLSFQHSTNENDRLMSLGIDTNNLLHLKNNNLGTKLQITGDTSFLALKNITNENTDGGCESKIIFEDHANNILGQIQGSHDGLADDTKGELIFSTNDGSSLGEKMRIDSIGNVGIGISNPLHKLQFANSPESKICLFGDSSNMYGFGYSSNQLNYHVHSTTNRHVFYAGGKNGDGTELMRIQGNGNVGIGTNSPSEALDIVGNINSSGNVNISGGLNILNTAPTIILKDTTDDDDFRIYFQNNSSSNLYSIDGVGDTFNIGTKVSRDLKLKTNDTDALVINTSQNVGIGISNPNGKLDILDSSSNNLRLMNTSTVGVKFQAVSNSNLRITPVETSKEDILELKSTSGTARMKVTTTNSQSIALGITDNSQAFLWNYNNTDIQFGTNNTEVMRIDNTGNVGIGDNNPGTQLQITGSEPYITLKNSTDENNNGGCESRIIFEDHSNTVLGQIQVSHDGSADDTKGDLIFSTNSGSALTERMRIRHNGSVNVHSSLSAPNLYGNTVNISQSSNTAGGGIHTWYIKVKDDENGAELHFQHGGSGGLSKARILWHGSNVTLNFTGQHRSFMDQYSLSQLELLNGLIVCANKNKYTRMSDGIAKGKNAITINESLPDLSICNKDKDKSVFGVISNLEDPNERKEQIGAIIAPIEKENGDTRPYINSVGEGAIWVTDKNGNLESGDYITSCTISGYGMKQDSDSLKNYTVAKITMDCDFNPVTQPVPQILKDTDGNNILDSNGYLQWENHATETEKAYNLRYLLADGTQITEADYTTRKSNGENVYKAAFVGCTYHCG